MRATTRSVAESLEALPAVFASARADRGGDRPLHVGPSAIGMRGNPYGAAPMENPDDYSPGDEPRRPPSGSAGSSARPFRARANYARCAEGGVAEGDARRRGGRLRDRPRADTVRPAVVGRARRRAVPGVPRDGARLGENRRPPHILSATSSLPRAVLAAGAENGCRGATLLLANLTDETQGRRALGAGRGQPRAPRRGRRSSRRRTDPDAVDGPRPPVSRAPALALSPLERRAAAILSGDRLRPRRARADLDPRPGTDA